MTTVMVAGEMRIRLFSLRGNNQVMRACHLETMEQIRDVYLPFHFSLVAFTRYPGVFAKRSAKYQRFKARTVGHQRPNQFTGALMASVLAESVCRATPDRGTFEAKAPKDSTIKYGPQAGKVIRRPLTEQRRREMEFVSDAEISEQCERMKMQYVASAYDPEYSDKVLKQFR